MFCGLSFNFSKSTHFFYLSAFVSESECANVIVLGLRLELGPAANVRQPARRQPAAGRRNL